MKTFLTLLIIWATVPMKLEILKSDKFECVSSDKNVEFVLKNDSTIAIRYNGFPPDSLKVTIKTPAENIRIETQRELKLKY